MHVLSASWSSRPLTSISRSLAREWWSALHTKGSSNPTHKAWTRARQLKISTLRNIRQTARKCFADAFAEGLLELNPFEALPIARSRRARMEEAFTYLRRGEQPKALGALKHLPERWLVQFAIGSGLRAGEQWALRWSDVDWSNHTVFVRFGSVTLKKPKTEAVEIAGAWFGPTKGGTPRRIPIFGLALEALLAWKKIASAYAANNPHGLVFPRRSGKPRAKGRVFRGFSRIATSIGHAFNWHGCRHTCATSLVGGWWGEPWTLEEVRVFLGHASITTTERYAHFADELVLRAARQKTGVRAMVDENKASGVEATPSSELDELDDSGRLSSVVEQRFRNTEATAPAAGAGEDKAEDDGEPPSRLAAAGLFPRGEPSKADRVWARAFVAAHRIVSDESIAKLIAGVRGALYASGPDDENRKAAIEATRAVVRLSAELAEQRASDVRLSAELAEQRLVIRRLVELVNDGKRPSPHPLACLCEVCRARRLATLDRDALPFGERPTSQGLDEDDEDALRDGDLAARHRKAVGLLSDIEKASRGIGGFLDREVKR